MKKLFFAISLSFGLFPNVGHTQELPDVSMFKMMLEGNKPSGWVSFRNYDGHQWVYFTPLMTLRCRIKQVRYSYNSTDLDEELELLPCIKALPFSMPSDAPWDAIAKRLDLNSVQSATVQVVFDDDTESEIITFAPCEGVGDLTCARIVE